MASVSLSDLSVELGRRSILDRISLDIGDGTFAAVVGPSGVGKSTVLRAIAGLVVPVSGSILFDGVDMTRVKPAARDVGMVFQTPALLPNRNVRRNVEFPLELRGETAETMRDRVTAEARAMHIEHLLRRDPAHLSRGEQQLVRRGEMPVDRRLRDPGARGDGIDTERLEPTFAHDLLRGVQHLVASVGAQWSGHTATEP